MPHTHAEIIYSSRGIESRRDGFRQTIVARLCIDSDEEPGSSSYLWRLKDPPGVDPATIDQKTDALALEYAYEIFPPYKEVPMNDWDRGFLEPPDLTGLNRHALLTEIGIEQIGPTFYEARGLYEFNTEVGYGGFLPTQGGVLPYVKRTWRIGGGKKRVWVAAEVKDTKLSNPIKPGTVANDFGAAIGVSKDKAEGMLVPDGKMILQITGYYTPEKLTVAFEKVVKSLITGTEGRGTYNSVAFAGYDAGEVQLLSATRGGKVQNVVPITYDFLVSENVASINDPGFDTGTPALGHDIIDYTYKKEGVGGAVIMTPYQRRVLRVFEPVDYTALGLPSDAIVDPPPPGP